jgi:threonine/homoserine/homoserine lactone efflux protein
MLFVVLGTAVDIAYALLAGAAGGWLRRRSAVARVQRYVTGGVYVGLGVFAAVAGDD